MSEKLTNEEFLGLFGRTPEQSRWAGSADPEEYLTLVTYLIERSHWSQASSDSSARPMSLWPCRSLEW